MDAQNTRSLKIMTFSKLVDLAYDTNNYIIYVFLILDNDDIKRFGTKYLMCTQYPNWDHRKLNIGEEGYLFCEEIIRGVTEWYDGQKFVPHNYDHFHFIKFIPKKKTNNEFVI